MVNRWWDDHPSEIYWIEITGRPDIGADLKAPQSTNSGHFLVKEVKSGDVVYHYDINSQSFVGHSIGTGNWREEDIEWPHLRPGWYADIVGFEPIGPITLARFQEDWDLIASKRAELISMVKTAYFPFESGEKRPTRPVQGGYLCKMPRFMVEFLDLLDPGQPLTEKESTSNSSPSIGITARDIVSPFGQKLEATMVAKGMNASQVATLAGCNPSTVRNIISGRIKTPSVEMSERISSVLEDDFEILDPDVMDLEVETEDSEGSEFAKEKDLQNFLVKNLHMIEPGLKLYDDGLRDGVEYPAGRRFIDILAQDTDGQLVVIELKVSRGHDRTIGQILNYIGWVRENLVKPNQEVRGIIIAKEITEDLRLTCLLPQIPVSLREYSISFSLKDIS
ncbi:endonuclease NucS [Candidatus Poseidonia sp.]|nr:endonuclease NucS [Poseidonia sp.]